MRSGAVGGFLVVLVCASSSLSSADPAQVFDEAGRREIEGHAHLAFMTYRRAAEAGLPDAEFNTAVMLDSGRGVKQDLAQAATWYARAAAHGHHRAAYNLGQLYEAGEGVPKNADIARAWFTASGLPAARAHLDAPRLPASRDTTLAAPNPVAPAAGATIDRRIGGIELVWTAPPQPKPVRYYIEVRALGASGSREVFSAFAETSSLFATPSNLGGAYAWRVIAVASTKARYAASGWLSFRVAAE